MTKEMQALLFNLTVIGAIGIALLVFINKIEDIDKRDRAIQMTSPPPPCMAIAADLDADSVNDKLNSYYRLGLNVHFMYGNEDGSVVICFIKGYEGDAKRMKV